MELAKRRKSIVEEDLMRRYNRAQVRRLSEIQHQCSIKNASSEIAHDPTRERRLSMVHSELKMIHRNN